MRNRYAYTLVGCLLVLTMIVASSRPSWSEAPNTMSVQGSKKKKAHALIFSASPPAEAVTEQALQLSRAVSSSLGRGVTLQALQKATKKSSKKMIITDQAVFAVNDARASGRNPASGRVITKQGDFYALYLPTSDGKTIALVATSRRPVSKSRADRTLALEHETLGFKLWDVVLNYQIALWSETSPKGLAATVSKAPTFVSRPLSPAAAEKILSSAGMGARGGGGPKSGNWCGTVGTAPEQPSPGSGSDPSNDPGEVGDPPDTLEECRKNSWPIFCVLYPPGWNAPRGSGCFCQSPVQTKDPTECASGKLLCTASVAGGRSECGCTGGESNGGGAGSGGGGNPPPPGPDLRDGNGRSTEDCPGGQMICQGVNPGNGSASESSSASNGSGASGCWCPGDDGGPPPSVPSRDSGGGGDSAVKVPVQALGDVPILPIGKPTFAAAPRENPASGQPDAGCVNKCGDGICYGPFTCMATTCTCAESEETCSQDC